MAHITIATGSTSDYYVATSGQTVFSISFEFFDVADLNVYQNGTLLTRTTHYTVTPDTTYDGGYNGGTITLVTGATLSDDITIVLNMSAKRSTDFPTAGPFNITTLNTWIDKMMVLFKQTATNMVRKVGRPESSSETYSLDWPDGATSTVSAIMVDTSGGITIGPTVADITSASANATAAAASAAAASTSEGNAATSETNAAASAVIAQAVVDSITWEVTQLTFSDSPYTATSADAGKMLSFNTSGGAIALNLPSIAVVGEPFNIAIKKSTGDTNAITITPNGTDTIDGSATKTISSLGSSYFYADIDTTPDEWIATDTGAAAGNMSDETFVDVTDYTAGTSTSLTLANVYGSETNIWVAFDGVPQGPEEYSLSGTTLTFTSVIPLGVGKVYVKGGTTLSLGIPADGSVGNTQMADNAVGANELIDTAVTAAAYTNANITVDAQGRITAAANGSSATLATRQATTSGTAFDFTGIPAGTSKIEVYFDQCSLTGADSFLVQLGDSGGFETTGYVGQSSVAGAAGVASTAGMPIYFASATQTVTGTMVIDLVETSSNTWQSTHNAARTDLTSTYNGSSVKSLSAELTQIRFTRTGADTFDAGNVTIRYSQG